MIDPTCWDDRTDDDVFYYNGYSGSEFVSWALLFILIAAIFGFGFFCGSVFA